MEVCRSRKREGEACSYGYSKHSKGSSDDQDSESYSVGSTNASSPRDSGFRGMSVLRSISGDDAPARQSEGSSSQELTALPGRVKILEEKVDWIGRELQLIREMLQFITKVMPAGSSQHLMPNDSRQKTAFRNGKRSNNSGKSEKARRYLTHSKTFNKVGPGYSTNYGSSEASTQLNEKGDSYQSNSSSDEKNSIMCEIENRENTSSASKSCSDFYDSDTYADRGESNGGSGSGSGSRAGSGSGSGSGEGGTESSDQGSRHESPNNVPDAKFQHSIAISGLDVIYLWEHGTDEMLPIRHWNETQLELGGEVIRKWRQIMQFFQVECNGSLKTFVNKYTNADGKLMSVQEIISANQEVKMMNNCSGSTNGHSDHTCVSSSSHVSAVGSSTNGCFIPIQPDQKPQQVYFLPRKINGQKVSAKDVIHIWEEGFGKIPPVKSWTPNQKLKQQSKISRWKKIVDIYKTECNSNMNLFEMRYTNECGVLMPIAAIINKFEQNQSAVDPMKQMTMSSISTPVINLKSDVAAATNAPEAFGRDGLNSAHEFWRSDRGPREVERDWHTKDAQGCKDLRSLTIRQVEDWQRKNIKSKEEENRSIIARGLPPMHHSNLSNVDQRDFQSLSVSDQENRETNKMKKGLDNCHIEKNGAHSSVTMRNLANGEGLEQADLSDIKVASTLPSPNRQSSQKESSSASSDNGENSDAYSGKDIDVTGSESSLSLAPSKTYSPVQIKMPNSTELNGRGNSTELDSLRQDTSVKSRRAFEKGNAAELHRQISDDKTAVLPESDDPLEVLNLWENGSEKCPPIRFLTMNDDVIMHPRLVAWRKFIEIFRYHCNSDKQVLLEKYSDDKRRPLKISEILQRFEANFMHRPYGSSQRSMKAVPESSGSSTCSSPTPLYTTSRFQTLMDLKKPLVNNESMYILPRKINGHKVSARDVIHIWHHGLKNFPPVGSWLPHQKVRQQSKISRWKKIVEIFEVDCNGNMQIFDKKYSNKAGDLLPIAAIIAKYEAEKIALDGDSSINIKIDNLAETSY